MTPRDRLLKALHNEQPDHVPAAPDMSEMVPLRLLGRPSWECLLYGDPPIWKARMDACTHFGVDAFFTVFSPLTEPIITIVHQDDKKIITRDFTEIDGMRRWSDYAYVYTPNEPSAYVEAATIGLPAEHDEFVVQKPNYSKFGAELFEDARSYVGERGVVGPMVFLPAVPTFVNAMYRYYDDHDAVLLEMRQAGEQMMKEAETYLSWKPDVLWIGNSGLMISNPVPIFREICLEWLKKVTNLAKVHGIPIHMHCCGPSRALVEIAANETDLTSIEPLEVPPMGDCNLKELKMTFGHKLAFKGNLHTTSVMLRGTPQIVEDACKKAIDDAAAGGGFILSTGDQTPWATPDENIRTMQRVAETYGKY